MVNQKVSTAVGAGILIIFSISVFAFVWKYENNLPQIDASTSSVVVPKKIVSVTRELKEENTEDCSGHEDRQRICKDGTFTGMFDSRCLPILCSSGRVGENIETSYYSPYIKKGPSIFLEGPFSDAELTPVVGADFASFRPIGVCASVEMSRGYYGKDKNHIYVGSEFVNSIDSGSFQYLGLLENGYGMPYSTSVSVDKDHVYFGCGVVADSVDRGSFRILESGYSKDKNRIYHLDFTVPVADYKTFEVLKPSNESHLQGNFALDKDHVFVEGMILKGIDPKICKSNGLAVCLPDNWEELIDDSTQGEKLSNVY